MNTLPKGVTDAIDKLGRELRGFQRTHSAADINVAWLERGAQLYHDYLTLRQVTDKNLSDAIAAAIQKECAEQNGPDAYCGAIEIPVDRARAMVQACCQVAVQYARRQNKELDGELDTVTDLYETFESATWSAVMERDHLARQNATLQAENERLRKALNEAIDFEEYQARHDYVVEALKPQP